MTKLCSFSRDLLDSFVVELDGLGLVILFPCTFHRGEGDDLLTEQSWTQMLERLCRAVMMWLSDKS